jgi:hypothetical protein
MSRRITIIMTARRPEDPRATLEAVVQDVNSCAAAAESASWAPLAAQPTTPTIPDEPLETQARQAATAALDEREEQLRRQTPHVTSAPVQTTAPDLQTDLARLQQEGIRVTAELLSEALVALAHEEGP